MPKVANYEKISESMIEMDQGFANVFLGGGPLLVPASVSSCIYYVVRCGVGKIVQS